VQGESLSQHQIEPVHSQDADCRGQCLWNAARKVHEQYR
jgi:hypothetical protein